MKRKWLAVGITLLFIGVAVAPSINQSVVKASTDNDLVEVTTQACGIKGYGDTTVKLTREQYNNLEEYLVDFRARLNQTTTKEEAVPIFKEAVVELDRYGLLPKGMSVERAQKLVINGNQNQLLTRTLKRIFSTIDLSFYSSNFLCLIAGQGTEVTVGFSNDIWLWFWFPTRYYNGIDLIGLLTFGRSSYTSGGLPPIYHPCIGWVETIGLLGKKNWTGEFRGAVAILPRIWYREERYIGAIPFTGIRHYEKENRTTLFLGSALYSKILY